MRLLWRVRGAGNDDEVRKAVAVQKTRKRMGARPAERNVVVNIVRAGVFVRNESMLQLEVTINKEHYETGLH